MFGIPDHFASRYKKLIKLIAISLGALISVAIGFVDEGLDRITFPSCDREIEGYPSIIFF